MPNYNCDLCNFKSNRKTDHSRHIKSKKHLENVSQTTITHIAAPDANPTDTFTENVYVCSNCNNKFTRSSSLTRHKKVCVDTIIKDTKVTQLEKENERLLKQVETYESMLKSITSPQIVNYFNYICTNYPNTPALISQKSHVGLLEAKTMTLVEVIIMYHNNKTLANFIGDYIIKLYKKEEPKNQSMWSTDISRLTYIISESCGKDKSNMWAYDKKGLKIKKIIIEPALQYIKDVLFEFCQENSTAMDGPEFQQLKGALEIIPTINNGTLADEITKYIAPEFVVNTNDNKAIVKV